MSKARRDDAACHLRFLRLELRELDLMLKDEDILPDPGEIRALLSQLEALLNVVEDKKKKKFKAFKGDKNTVSIPKAA